MLRSLQLLLLLLICSPAVAAPSRGRILSGSGTRTRRLLLVTAGPLLLTLSSGREGAH